MSLYGHVSKRPFVSTLEGHPADTILIITIDNDGLLECGVEVGFTTVDDTACKYGPIYGHRLSMQYAFT